MKFIVASGELQKALNTVSGVISSSQSRPILENYLFEIEENNLKIKFIDNSHFASERALTISQSVKGISLSLYKGNNFLSFIFSLDGKPVLFKVAFLESAVEIPQIILKETSPTEAINLNRSMIDSFF
ncbi:MAG: hypothetical protein ACXWVZ_06595, partial [Kaistella sp.]